MGKPKNEFNHPYVTIWLEGEFLMGKYEDVHINIEIARDIVKERLRVFGTEPRLAIIEIRGSVTYTKEARDYLGSEEACVGAKKLALIATSPISVTVGNFFIKIAKPPVPTKIFRNIESAKKWLLKL
ncbi:MAG TPA: hypothetical protein VNB90_13535 [Cytophagaceae bacterium]|jgi:hypothetical protein|nr:hypothetical protein [Cytophagaceae bacterium]